MKIKPFILLGASRINSLRESFQINVDAWSADWFMQSPPFKLIVSTISHCFDDYRHFQGIRFVDAKSDHWAVYAFDKADCQRLGAMLIGIPYASLESSPRSDIVSGIVRSALLDLTRHVLPPSCDECTVAEEEPVGNCIPAEVFKPGNQALHLQVDLGGVAINVWLPIQPLLQRITAPPDAESNMEQLVDRRKAVGNQRIIGKILLGNADLTLDSVANLKIGDIIRLDKELKDPLSLSLDNSSTRFSGYLGKQNNHFAFQIDSVQVE